MKIRKNDSSVSQSKGREFSCSKCGHSNANNATVCTSCGSHLFIKCRKCRANNQRTQSVCKECGTSLHR
ncbi:MAG: zinc-ribbon domain-containing protein, partial [Verrucomicrobia bacterium]